MRLADVVLALALAPFVVGCGPSTGSSDGGLPGSGDGDAPIDLNASAGDGPSDGGSACGSSVECDGGVCVGGRCCASEADVCGGACCPGGTVCLFDKCVTPGKPCHTANDCAPGQYCETGLSGGSDGGASDGGGLGDAGTCTQPLPLSGRCLESPPRCGDGGVQDGGCLAPCEYHPKVGVLTPVARWSWGPTAKEYPNYTDVWSTPTVGRLHDANCDGKIDELDSPNIIFVSGAVAPTNSPRDTGVLRVLDGRTGQEVWSLRKAGQGSMGFMGFSVAIGDVDLDGFIDIIAVTGEKYVVLIDHTGKVLRTSDKPVPGGTDGWGGGPALADMDGDGRPEIAFGATVFTTTNNALTRKFVGAGGSGGGANQELSTFVDLDGANDGNLELLAGTTAYRGDGTMLWDRKDLPEGFPGVGDFDKDSKPEAVLVANGQLWILEGATGKTVLGPLMLPGSGSGGPPTVADFDGDGKPEIGVAKADFYSVVKADLAQKKLTLLWKTQNHDLSSSVTGSSVFDFEADGIAEVVYGDECFLWVFDGPTGKVRFSTSTTSFTATEASVVADVDGDGHAEIVMISNGASPVNWKCVDGNGKGATVNGATWKAPPKGPAYRGITVFGDQAGGWVGTRTLWNQHSYHVTNICDARDAACHAPNLYGAIPKQEIPNWKLPWLNNFRQNVQDRGVFDAPDATASLTADCTTPVVLRAAVRNLGLAALPGGVVVHLFVTPGDKLVGKTATTHALFPGQSEQLVITLAQGDATFNDTFYAKIIVDPQNLKFHECRDDNNQSPPIKPACIQ
ncbi:MAG: VCBS repeat-containing protein [Myxococcales bacterium]|nr:VCBS repeat-containing protein [Myxococcales bacterium]